MIALRVARKVDRGKWDEYMALRAQVNAIWDEAGCLRARLFRPFFGGEVSRVAINERDFESLSALDEVVEKLRGNPELSRLEGEMAKMAEVISREILRVL